MIEVMAGISKRLCLFLSILVFTVLIISSMPNRVESIHNEEQEDAATGIALTCAALLEGCARQPEACGLGEIPPSGLLIDLYNDAVDDIKSLNLESSPDDIASAKGIIYADLITAVARQPELEEELRGLSDLCNNDIESL